MNVPSPELLALIAYRMHAVAIGHLALKHALSWDQAPAVQILFDGKLTIEGKATVFTNGAIEVGILHCRALLEFIGLRGQDQFALAALDQKRRLNDIGIEQFTGLRKLTVQDVVRAYPGGAKEAESALAYILYLANKGLAHLTDSFTKHPDDVRLLEIGFRGVPQLVINSFHLPLGIAVPDYQIQSRLRDFDR